MDPMRMFPRSRARRKPVVTTVASFEDGSGVHGGQVSTLRLSFRTSLAVAAAALCVSWAHAQVTIDWVTVGNAGNASDSTTGNQYGAVNYDYRIGKYEVTIGQYAEFLNAVAATDTYSVYSTNMATNLNIAGISRSGSSGSYTYSVIGPAGIAPAGASSPGNRPITNVSWWDAARFANWMHNGQGSGDTETGAYTLNGATSGTAPAKNPGAQFYVPTQNEWYKAAYYSPEKGGVGSPGYYTYATQSDSDPSNIIGGGPNQANYFAGNPGKYAVTQSGSLLSNQNYVTDVGAFSNSLSYYGTFDQSGNVYEWNDLTGAASASRGLRGGFWDDGAFGQSSSNFFSVGTTFANSDVGFRLASPTAVPEPSTWVMAGVGIACAGWGAFRRRKQA